MTISTNASPFDQTMRLRLLQIGGGLVAFALLVIRPVFSMEAHEFIEDTGLLVVVIGIAGRLWSTLYIGGRKNDALVTTGPYSITRNPLYVSSCIAAAGVGLMAGSLVIAATLFVLAYCALGMARNGEEKYLDSRYGAAFAAYRTRTPRFWPQPLLYREGSSPTFSPKALRRTFVDGLWFIALFPALELVEHLQDVHVLPVWLTLY
ncbi:methyltransferase family protein [Pararhizobium mangrovi]|uniref:Isoprenylcysteine carboxylmethyltransferase family protein n=1 Tax=Pararhizobium mangrovi TaxID=2590452 RepID=A0A506U0H1_9HYPH|nr:isoprenylcysteine carboxylmethyltransferase family protein [Pararhizobium mangrovi]TPW26465.1 isoprenylcysteine carboxylmethyltransferase family protein [Pararhizobium mangrovi]